MRSAVGRPARFTAALALASVGVLLGAAPAAAHGSGQNLPDAVYYRTELTDVTPTVAGVTASADPAGEWIGLSNTGPAVVIVLGYTREPYLRVTADSAEENELSPTTYINRAMFADSVPSGTDPGSVAPSWKQVATTGSVRWHDHRVHWMGQSRPPEVAADPTHPHQVGTWTVHATADGVPFDLHGTLRWLGKPDTSPLPPWFFALVSPLILLIAVAAWHVLQQRRRAGPAGAGPAGAGPAVAGPAAVPGAEQVALAAARDVERP